MVAAVNLTRKLIKTLIIVYITDLFNRINSGSGYSCPYLIKRPQLGFLITDDDFIRCSKD